MKRISLTLIAIMMTIGYTVNAQNEVADKADSTGLPGDNFSLQGALEMFKQAKSLEEFEKAINDKNNNINNLDLNGDNKIDYIRVVDNMKNDAHAVVMQVPVNKTEFQDIAVIEIEKQGAEQVSVQIVGDEDIYGENVIYEPKNEKAVGTDGKGGPSAEYFMVHGWYNAWFWPCVMFLYAPAYTPWVSPWYWDYYPYWWSPWNPYPWSYHYYHCYHHHHYHDYYHHSHEHYGHNAYQAYQPNRHSSGTVVNRHRDVINSYRTANTNNFSRSGKSLRPIEGTRGTGVDTRSNRNTNTDLSKPRREGDPNINQNRREDRPQVDPNRRDNRQQVDPNRRENREQVKPERRDNNQRYNQNQRESKPRYTPERKEPRTNPSYNRNNNSRPSVSPRPQQSRPSSTPRINKESRPSSGSRR